MPESSTNKQLNKSHRWQGLIHLGFEKEEAETNENGYNIELGAGERVFTRWASKR